MMCPVAVGSILGGVLIFQDLVEIYCIKWTTSMVLSFRSLLFFISSPVSARFRGARICDVPYIADFISQMLEEW